MDNFSIRMGFTQRPTELQISGMSPDLRSSLWNALADVFPDPNNWMLLLRFLFIRYFKRPVDLMPTVYQCRGWLMNWFMECQWHEVYSLIENILTNARSLGIEWSGLEEDVNYVLERELAGFRAVKGQFIPVVGEEEVAAIKEASSTKYSGVNEHIDAAMRCLGKKPEPDYRGSVRESITAVESACKLITGKTSGGIDDALKVLDARAQGTLHPVLRTALSKLYAYTSDKEGIRHAILDQATIDFSEAKFMLVACSAFVNLLIDRTRQ